VRKRKLNQGDKQWNNQEKGVNFIAFVTAARKQHNDQAQMPPKAGATGACDQSVGCGGGWVQRFVVTMLEHFCEESNNQLLFRH